MTHSHPLNRLPVILGVVGGIASGKSYLCKLLATHGGEVIDADRLGHYVLLLDEIKEKLVNAFGTAILGVDGTIDRRRLAELVFGDPHTADDRRNRLEQIVHPPIRLMAEERIEQLRSQEVRPKAIILDAPLLLEAHWDQLCDAVIFVDVEEKVRQKRALERGWTLEQFTDRERSQMSLAEKRARSTHVIDNNPGADVAGQIRSLWITLVEA
jgi:dephospho-CoA kinase